MGIAVAHIALWTNRLEELRDFYVRYFDGESGPVYRNPAKGFESFFVRFDGVYMKSQVWINGRMVGEYPNGYNSFEYDIPPFVRRDTLNVLAVRVDNSLQPGSRWYTGSGIYRNVHLIVTSQMHFTDGGVFITTPEVSAERARIEINYHVINHNYPETRFTWTDNKSLYVWLRDGNADAAPKTGCRKNARSLRSSTTQTARK